jgi:hypothetical protein
MNFLPESVRYHEIGGAVTRSDSVSSKQSSTSRKKKRVYPYKKMIELEKENKNLRKLVDMRLSVPDIIDNTSGILIGDMFEGELEQYVLSTNLGSPVNVRLSKSSMFPNGAKVICEGKTYMKRVDASCSVLRVDGVSYKIEGKVLEIDGSRGLRGEYYSGKEEYMAAIIATEASKGALALSLERQTTINGDVVKNDPRNVALGAVINSASAASEMMTDEMKSKEPKVFIRAKKKVLLYFDKDFKFSKNEVM